MSERSSRLIFTGRIASDCRSYAALPGRHRLAHSSHSLMDSTNWRVLPLESTGSKLWSRRLNAWWEWYRLRRLD